MNMDQGIAMGKVKTSACALIFLGSLVWFASTTLAQTCTPVVYAFRHAEDTNPDPPPPIFTLTPTGKAHAALYPSMVSDFQSAPNNFCPVTKVYATTKAEKINCTSNCASATNAFDTARPLACWAPSQDLMRCSCWLRSTTPQELAQCDAQMNTAPSTKVQYELYEFVGNGNNPPTNPNYMTPEAIALRNELIETAKAGGSSAIFWTSDGLHVLAGAIINGTSKVPDKKGSDPKATKGTPPRNEVYVFQFMPAQGQFSDVAKADLFVQGYNRAETSGKFPKGPAFIPANPDGTQDYYAGYQPNVLGGVLNDKPCAVGDPCGSTIATVDLQMVKGKICNTSTPLKNSPGPGYYGACQGQ
jgi:hypothetical protein